MADNTKLLTGLFKQSEDKGKEYLLYLDIDRLLAPCYEAVCQTPKKPRYGGWESTEIAGHSVGHWLSAAAAMYAVTEDRELKQKIDYAVEELEQIQKYDGEGYVSGFSRTCFDNVFSGDFQVDNFSLGGSWVPWYSIHKIYAGLIDVYTILRDVKALEIVLKLASWAKAGLDKLSDEQFERMLICEHGGMNEVMADLYIITGKQGYLDLAKRFCHQAILQPLSQSIDDLEGKHANTQIPKVIGAAKLYDITGDLKYKEMAVFFWQQVTNYRSYVIGGNSIGEHFGPSDQEQLGVTSAETCNTHNMLKLTEYLYRWSHKSVYMDYYERALYNHILASQDPDSGMTTYFVSTQPGHFKVYCSPEDSFWCCTGTGMENPALYTRNIYYQEQDQLYVNLFIASELTVAEKQLKISQETSFPASNRSTLVFKEANHEKLTVHIRVPYWGVGAVTATINGTEVFTHAKNGYLTINREWKSGDCVEIELPMNLHRYVSSDNPQKQAIMYGPIVLAGALGKEHFPETDILEDHMKLDNHPLIDVPVLVADTEDLNHWIRPIENSILRFETLAVGQSGNQKITLIPFYQLHHQRYTIYWNIMNEAAYHNFHDGEEEELRRKRDITVDYVNPNEQQPEIEHHLSSSNSNSGYLNIVHKGWRDCRDEGIFSYEMAVQSTKQMYLVVTYFGSDSTLYVDGQAYNREFDIVVDGTVIVNQKLEAIHPGKLFDVCYEIPRVLTKEKERVEIKFSSKPGTVAGGVYGVRIINERVY
ncbi:glycoside hydrolase family 127 protein [Sporosarcina sp. ANT_H38]|uniref:glycoside hydrolase family 127 protein n=1 Tax=Sporosarcina sp. ANT_H38 TaxID=2597358 RepID=UPI0011F14144|nr:glycoside hydrolase family 127 protein [Sporosarcina sp. ANT_H38]KAA0965618.1 glycoside hydrolase family 127 protein [Sporosarcina sp. ANT_H38]